MITVQTQCQCIIFLPAIVEKESYLQSGHALPGGIIAPFMVPVRMADALRTLIYNGSSDFRVGHGSRV
jgi:hypothetical protein